VVHKVVLWQPGEALLVDAEVRQCRGHWSLRQQRADRFTLVQSEGRDVDQADDVGRVRAQRGDDLAAIRVAGDEGRAVLAGQHLAQPGDVIRQRGQRELGCCDVVAVGLQALDDGAPTGAVGPGTMH
jgi:hypothetical protein